MAQEAQVWPRTDPAEAEHDGIELDRAASAIAHDAIEARSVVGRVERNRHGEGAEPLHSRRERPLDKVQRADRSVVATLQRGVGRVTQAEPDRLHAARALVTGKRRGASHGGGL